MPGPEPDALAREAVAADLQDAGRELHELTEIGRTDVVIACRRSGSGCRGDTDHLARRQRRQHRRRDRGGLGIRYALRNGIPAEKNREEACWNTVSAQGVRVPRPATQLSGWCSAPHLFADC